MSGNNKSAVEACIILLLLLILLATNAGFSSYALLAAFAFYLWRQRIERGQTEQKRAELIARIYAVEQALKGARESKATQPSLEKRVASLEEIIKPKEDTSEVSAGTVVVERTPEPAKELAVQRGQPEPVAPLVEVTQTDSPHARPPAPAIPDVVPPSLRPTPPTVLRHNRELRRLSRRREPLSRHQVARQPNTKRQASHWKRNLARTG